MTYEIRSGLPVEIRAEGNAFKVSGYAAVFNERTDVGGMFIEVIEPGAFKDAVGRDDVLFLVNHIGMPLARTRSGTLILKEDERGLYMETELDPDDPDVQAIVPKMKRGDLDKMSFAFIAEAQSWDESGDIAVRTLQKVRLRDVSIVNYAQYEGTEIGLRSLQEFRSANLNQIQHASAANVARMRMKLALAANS